VAVAGDHARFLARRFSLALPATVVVFLRLAPVVEGSLFARLCRPCGDEAYEDELGPA